MEVKRLGNLYGFDGGNFAGNVYEKDALAPTILNMQGGGRQPMVIDKLLLQRKMFDYVFNVKKEAKGIGFSDGVDGSYVNPKVANTIGCRSATDQRSGTSNYVSSLFNDELRVAKMKELIENGIEWSEFRIRKLSPLECWRLMDFSDEDFHKAESVNSNTQLYKQAGNSIVRNVLVSIFGQMLPGKEDEYKKGA